ncbi:MAG TPA: RND transporter, partial [Bryobacteraceae bacterium]
MDIKRSGVAKKKIIRRVVYLTLSLAVAGVAAWRINQMKPAAPSVEAATLWPGTVQRGPMVRDVRG